MAAGDHIIALFKPLQEEGQTVELLVVYKGIPVHISASILKVDKTEVTFKVQPPNSICLRNHRFALVQSNAFVQTMRGKISDFNLRTGTLKMEGLYYVTYTERSRVRVEPRNMVPVEIDYRSQRIVGTLVDISEIGAGIYMTNSLTENDLQRTEKLQMTLRLPLGLVEAQAKVRAASRSVDFYRLAVNFIGLSDGGENVRKYIEQRQTEILSELPRLYSEGVAGQSG